MSVTPCGQGAKVCWYLAAGERIRVLGAAERVEAEVTRGALRAAEGLEKT